MQNILELETSKYKLKLESFEGPLDLLCHLIDKNKLNIHDIKISDITDQYIGYINEMEEMNLEVTSEFLVMASTLLYLKSKSLLPKQSDSEEELTEEELIERIIKYKQYKEISKALMQMYLENRNRIFKFPETIELPKQTLEVDYTKDVLVENYEMLIQKNGSRLNKNAKNIERIAITENYTVGSKVKEIFKELLRKPSFVFNQLFSVKKCDKQEVVTAFNGLLEMSRRNKVKTDQEDIFGDIVVSKNRKR